MNLTDHTPLPWRSSGGGPEDLDLLLQRFFRAALPDPWPKFQAPADRTPAVPVWRWALLRSRMALAASIGFLLVGSWCLSARLPDYGAVSIDAVTRGAGRANARRSYQLPKANGLAPTNAAPTPGTPGK